MSQPQGDRTPIDPTAAMQPMSEPLSDQEESYKLTEIVEAWNEALDGRIHPARLHELIITLRAFRRGDLAPQYEVRTEYGHLVTKVANHEFVDPMWLPESRGRNYATHQRTVLVGSAKYITKEGE